MNFKINYDKILNLIFRFNKVYFLTTNHDYIITNLITWQLSSTVKHIIPQLLDYFKLYFSIIKIHFFYPAMQNQEVDKDSLLQ